MDWQDEIRNEPGTERAKPRTLAVALALLVIVAAGAFAYFADGKQRTPKDFKAEIEYRSPEVRAADAATRNGRAQLQRLVLGRDIDVANQAVLKLTLAGDEGWLALYEVLPRASKEVVSHLQSASPGPGRLSSAARALESGSDAMRDGAYLAIELPTPDAFVSVPEDLSAGADDGARVFRALMNRVDLAEENEARKLRIALKRFVPIQYAESCADHQSAIVRAAAASRLWLSNATSVEGVLERLERDPDPTVRDEAKDAMAKWKSARSVAKSPSEAGGNP